MPFQCPAFRAGQFSTTSSLPGSSPPNPHPTHLPYTTSTHICPSSKPTDSSHRHHHTIASNTTHPTPYLHHPNVYPPLIKVYVPLHLTSYPPLSYPFPLNTPSTLHQVSYTTLYHLPSIFPYPYLHHSTQLSIIPSHLPPPTLQYSISTTPLYLPSPYPSLYNSTLPSTTPAYPPSLYLPSHHF